tara:strand:- start:471 stop:695 length:225 start_codon:yes stop_codon:yes gene_type:complete
MTSSQLGDDPTITNYEDTYYDNRWQEFVEDEANERGIDLKDSLAMEQLEEELEEQVRNHEEDAQLEMALEAQGL